MKSATQTIARYLEDHAVTAPRWVDLPAPSEELRICVVIPAYDERPRIEAVIESLQLDRLCVSAVEILVCINHAVDSPPEVKHANRDTLAHLRTISTPFPLHLIDRCEPGHEFPADRAGVGRARRLLMDLATARLAQVGRSDTGLIACLDGDSPADPGYLDAIWEEMNRQPRPLAGVCRYRHPVPSRADHARAIMAYEVWMRYFEAALHLTTTPYAFQSIGSCMVLSARGYALADGVPPREALSDFYLLQKVVKSGGPGSVRQLTAPLVRPSSRPSTRVPRGTGPSVRASMEEDARRFVWVEPPQAFFALRDFFVAVPTGFDDPAALKAAATPFLTEIVGRWNGWTTIDKLRTHAPDPRRFERQFHTWFDSLKIVKFANRSRERRGGVFVFDALSQILDATSTGENSGSIVPTPSKSVSIKQWRDILELLRDRELHWWEPRDHAP